MWMCLRKLKIENLKFAVMLINNAVVLNKYKKSIENKKCAVGCRIFSGIPNTFVSHFKSFGASLNYM